MYGGFWRRLVALYVDSLFLQFIQFIILIIVVSVYDSSIICSILNGTYHIGITNLDIIIKWTIYISFFNFISMWLYFAIFESSPLEATPGKIALGMSISNLYGGRISFLRATGRFLGKIISSVIFCIGYLMVAFTENKQGLHDFIAGTVVNIDNASTGTQKEYVQYQIMIQMKEGRIRNYEEQKRMEQELIKEYKTLKKNKGRTVIIASAVIIFVLAIALNVVLSPKVNNIINSVVMDELKKSY